MNGLYPIVDLDTLSKTGFSPLDFAERVLRARPPLLQLRAKHASARHTLELLLALKPACAAAGTLLFANDRPDLAVLAGADGVHVGQDDLSVEDVRAFAPQLKVGVSTHDSEQLQSALAARPDYVAFGPVFPTRSKHNPEPVVGLAALAEARRRAHERGIRLVAIGGIDAARLAELAPLGVSVSLISALVAPSLDEVEARARELSRLFESQPT
ncbi:MAG: thiamine phosphate synthase [Polyangiaceae bacterium]